MEIIKCTSCLKPEFYCLCSQIKKRENKFKVLILQHPQEPDISINTAVLVRDALANAHLKVGLSWPNIQKALTSSVKKSKAIADKEEKTLPTANQALKILSDSPKDWGVLYYGSGLKREETPSSKNKEIPGLYVVDKKGQPLVGMKAKDTLKKLKGIILLDGSWSQAKALWWRNAWLLKMNRLVLIPEKKSQYDLIRKEPKRNCLSTIETCIQTLEFLGEKPEAIKELNRAFDLLLKKVTSKKSAQ